MIQSMTGYGKSILQLPSKKITIEIKSLNSKNLDLHARVPSSYREKELELRNQIAQSLSRGKVDFNLYIEVTGEATQTKVNQEVVTEYMKQLQAVSEGDDIDLLKMAIRLPDALKTEREEIDPAEYEAGNKNEAISGFAAMQKNVDQAVNKGLIHKNQAARKKSRLSAQIKAL